MKKCTKCCEVKPLDAFSKDKQKRDGKCSRCKACAISYKKSRWVGTQAKKDSDKKYRESAKGRAASHRAASKYYAANRAAQIERVRSWQRTNPDMVDALSSLRRARKLSADSDQWGRAEVHSEANGRCLHCGIKVSLGEMHADHFIPLAKGGSNLRENIVCSCASCNLSKGAKLPSEWTSPNLIGGSN